LSDKIKKNGSNLLHDFSTRSHDLIYTLFSIFFYCQKIYKDVEKENDEINGNKEFHLVAAKKEIFKLLVVYLMPENADWIYILYIQP